MKRFHVHVNVADLGASTRYYSTLFAREPDVLKADYAKWMLEDPRINFAVSTRTGAEGLDHLGLQADSEGELGELAERLDAARLVVQKQPDTTCCYARSAKAWSIDPAGIAWESFYTHGQSTVYGHDRADEPEAAHATDASRVSRSDTTKVPGQACCGA